MILFTFFFLLLILFNLLNFIYKNAILKRRSSNRGRKIHSGTNRNSSKRKVTIYLIRFDLIKKAKYDAKKEAESYSETRREINIKKETDVIKPFIMIIFSYIQIEMKSKELKIKRNLILDILMRNIMRIKLKLLISYSIVY